jgi:hypothetical protein
VNVRSVLTPEVHQKQLKLTLGFVPTLLAAVVILAAVAVAAAAAADSSASTADVLAAPCAHLDASAVGN